jgi:hypothetical protein
MEEVPKDQAPDEPKADRQRKARKAWQSPRIQSGTLFEANTLSCARTPGNPQCQVGPLMS